MALIKVPKMKARDYVNASWVNIGELFQKGLITRRIRFDPETGCISNGGLYFVGNEYAEEGWL